MYLFLAIVILLTGAIHFFLYNRFVSALEITSPSLLWPLRILAAFLAFSYIISRILEQKWPGIVAHVLDWMASIWIGAMLQFLWMCLLLFLIKLILVWTGVWGHWTPQEHTLIGRYTFAVVTLVTLSVCSYGVYRAGAPARIVKADIPVKNWTPRLGELTIILAADFHASNTMTPKRVGRFCEQISALNPDLILIPGDILDTPARELRDMPPAFHKLKAKYGIFGTTGNHEYYIGFNGAVDLIRESKIYLLMNEKAEPFPGLIIAGIEDRTARQFGRTLPSPEEILGPKGTDVTIFLNHTPATHDMEATVAAGADVVVCGHTHGGQLWPFRYLTKATFPFHHGLYRVGAGYVFTTCGIGFWGPPMRVGAPPEIVQIRLIPENEPPSVIW